MKLFILKENLIFILLFIMKKNANEERNSNFLKFFSSICSFKSKGIPQNQDILYKILQNEINQAAILIEIIK